MKLFAVPGAVRRGAARTPAQTEGPFYPDKLPLDTDNDLLIINDSITPAVGEITHLTGRILDADGSPVRNAVGRDLAVRRQRRLPAHRRQRPQEGPAGQELPGLRPVHDRRRPASTTSAPSSRCRTPAGRRRTSTSRSRRADRELLTTQIYIKGDPGNARDGVFRGIRDAQRPRAADGRVHADQGVEDRRAGGEVRHRAGPHAEGDAFRPRVGRFAPRSPFHQPERSPGCAFVREVVYYLDCWR